MNTLPTSSIEGAPSWRVANQQVEAYLTCVGGQLGPITFQTAHGPIQPYAIAPWSQEKLSTEMPPLLQSLRGDFFCLPFGDNKLAWKGERHPPHGDTANHRWTKPKLITNDGRTELSVEMKTKSRPGRVIKRIEIRDGETNVYSRHELHDFSGPFNLGHHAMLAFPEKGTGAIALSPYSSGQVCPRPFEVPAIGGYSALKMGATFSNLNKVPLATGGTTDLTHYPSRGGFEDLVMVSSRRRSGIAWTTVTFPEQGYLWFALKDPRSLASTVLWHSNGGRHYSPWNGRHRRVLGLEEVTSYFHFGLAESAAPNSFSKKGVPTVLTLRPNRVENINYIMGVVAIPRRFDRVRTIKFAGDHIEIESSAGPRVKQSVDLSFFANGAPARTKK